MLNQISIKNFTIIDELTLSLNHGMTVVTGETGAGKSIMVDAIELALGKRASTDMIKHNADRADISIEFNIENNPTAKKYLADNDLDDSETCLLRRTLHQDGRSKSYINGVPASLQNLRELGDLLINIHGQHEFQTLLERKQQLVLLDNFSQHNDLLYDMQSSFQAWQQAQTDCETLNTKMRDIAARSELLTFQLKALDELNLQENEIARINQEHQQLAHADTLLNHTQYALALLSENETGAVAQLLYQSHHAISQAAQYNPPLNAIAELINNASIQVDEAISDLRHFLAQINLDPERFTFIEERLSTIHALSKKHRIPPEELLSFQKQLQQELDQIEKRDEHLATLKIKMEANEKDYFTAAKKLSSSREKAAKKLEKMISENMHQLGMKGGKFSLAFETLSDNKPHPQGMEKVTFLVSANPGQPLQSLSKVASGGELSRISLAIQVITAKHSVTPTLIFDEVDAGIGGGIAEVVGTMLKELGASTQTLCITHLPQVAAKGHHHLCVTKQHNNNKTTTHVAYLENKPRIHEIARMSGGVKITPETLAHAKAMLDDK